MEEEIRLFFWNLLNLRYQLDIQRIFKFSMEEREDQGWEPLALTLYATGVYRKEEVF